jgi:hypothetical protein
MYDEHPDYLVKRKERELTRRGNEGDKSPGSRSKSPPKQKQRRSRSNERRDRRDRKDRSGSRDRRDNRDKRDKKKKNRSRSRSGSPKKGGAKSGSEERRAMIAMWNQQDDGQH